MTNPKLNATSLLCLTALLSACGGGSGGTTATTPAPSAQTTGKVDITYGTLINPIIDSIRVKANQTTSYPTTFTPDTDGLMVDHHVLQPSINAYQFFARTNQQISGGSMVTVYYNHLTKTVAAAVFMPTGMTGTYYKCEPCDQITLSVGQDLQSKVNINLNDQIFDLKSIEDAYDQMNVTTPDLFADPPVPTKALFSLYPQTNQVLLKGTLSGSSSKITKDASALPPTRTGELKVQEQSLKPIFSLFSPINRQTHVRFDHDYVLTLEFSPNFDQYQMTLRKLGTSLTGICQQNCTINSLANGQWQILLKNATFVTPDAAQTPIFGTVNANISFEREEFFLKNANQENPNIQNFVLQTSWIGMRDDAVVYRAHGLRSDDPIDVQQNNNFSVSWRVMTKQNQVKSVLLSLRNHSTQKISDYACDNKTSNPCTGVSVNPQTAEISFKHQALQLTYSSPIDQATYVSPTQQILLKDVLLDISGY